MISRQEMESAVHHSVRMQVADRLIAIAERLRDSGEWRAFDIVLAESKAVLLEGISVAKSEAR